MSTYILGDVHGCFDEMQLLLKQAKFNVNNDDLFIVGDLIARGPKSLECLEFVKGLGTRAHIVLGNHELHFLATAFKIHPINDADNLEAVFKADNFAELVDWIRHWPILIKHPQYNFLISHAGISPDWDETTALNCATEIENYLQNEKFIMLLKNMYGDKPNKWHENLQEIDKLRYSINAFTRMRYCYLDGSLDLICKETPKNANQDLKPWFLFDNKTYKTNRIVFGHWASLVGTQTPDYIYALDSGCVWGNYLTLLRWDDKKYFYQTKI